MIFDHVADHQACINKVERLSNCIEIANLISSELSIGKLLTHVMETTKKAFSADSVSLLLLDDKTGDLTFQVALGDVGDDIRELFRLKKGEGLAGYVAETGTPINLKDVYEDPRFSPDYDRQTGYRTKSMLCVSLKTRGKTVGVIQVMNKTAPPYWFTNEELDMLVTIGSSVAVAVDTAKMHQVILQKETLERDLKLASRVQQSFLPPALPQINGYRFFGLNRPALEIGGDFYNFFQLQDNRLGIVLGDVSGKGISASLFMARLTSDLQYHALLCASPARLLETINALLCRRAQRGMFVTLVYMVLDPDRHTLMFANAGHLFPILLENNRLRPLGSDTSKGPPLGILEDIRFQEEFHDLTPASHVLLCTDGITEAKNVAGKLFGEQRLNTEIGRLPGRAPDQMVRDIADAVTRFSQGQPASDDLTLVSFRRDSIAHE